MTTSASASRGIKLFFQSSLFRFLIIGGLSFSIDIGLLYFLYRIVLFPIWASTAIAFVLSFLFNFFMQRSYVFGSNTSKRIAFVKYFLLVIFNTIATVLIVSSLEAVIGWVQAKVLAVIVSTIWNYFAYKYVVFPKHDQNYEREIGKS